MNYRLIFNLLGKVLVLEAALLVLPLITSFVYLEWNGAMAFGITIAGALGLGLLLAFLVKPKKNQHMYAKEGLIITALAWIVVSLVGSLPFVISREIPSFIDALFEIVSGLTTTGASVLGDVEALSHGMLFWRSFSHWIGGMGVLVFVLAFVNRNDRSMHILRAEMPGPTVDKLVPKAKNTAFILYGIYVVLTLVLAIMLVCGDMNFFDAILHAFGTAGTGGFGIRNTSLTDYSSYSQWVIAIFMLLFGVNFNLYFLLILRKFSGIFRNTEFWVYICVVVASVTIITLNIYSLYGSVATALKHSTFQVASLMSTTGYSTADFDQWPALSKGILFTLMFIGGCAGSTSGGFKLTRVVILFKKIGNDLKRALHPRTATVVKINGEKVSEETTSGVTSYLAIYVLIFLAVFIILSLDPHVPQQGALETNISAAASAFNNIGPGFNAVGPTCNFGFYSPVSKIVLIFAMLLGRLEIYPILVALSPTTWFKR
ncbi:MAG: TrkH family potassium uptake protein [Clostridia bacterium]|nr:TrkH family potassium uptake protein [Clostridia bacterium]